MRKWRLGIYSSLTSIIVIAGIGEVTIKTATATILPGTPGWLGSEWYCDCTKPSVNCNCLVS